MLPSIPTKHCNITSTTWFLYCQCWTNINYWRPRIVSVSLHTGSLTLAQWCLLSPFLYKLIGSQHICKTWYFFSFTRLCVPVYFRKQVKGIVWLNSCQMEAGSFLTFWTNLRPVILTYHPATNVNMTFWWQWSDIKNPFSHKHSVSCFSATDVSGCSQEYY